MSERSGADLAASFGTSYGGARPPRPSPPPADSAAHAPISTPADDLTPTDRSKTWALLGIAAAVLAVVAITWLYRSRSRSDNGLPPLDTSLPTASGGSSSAVQTNQIDKPAPEPAPNAADARREQILSLQNLAREAYSSRNYAEPADANAIAYAQQVLAVDPANNYARGLLESGLKGARYQVQQALARKDFATAHRITKALSQLVPGWREVKRLREDITAAESAKRKP